MKKAKRKVKAESKDLVKSKKFGKLSNWKVIERRTWGGRKPIDGIYIQIAQAKKGNKMHVRIPKHFLGKQLSLSLGDRVMPYQDLDDNFLFMLALGTSSGFKVTDELKGKAVRFTIPFEGKIDNDKKSRPVEYEIINKQKIVFSARRIKYV